MGYNIHVDGEPGEQRNLRLWQNVPEDGHLEKEGGQVHEKESPGKTLAQAGQYGKDLPHDRQRKPEQRIPHISRIKT